MCCCVAVLRCTVGVCVCCVLCTLVPLCVLLSASTSFNPGFSRRFADLLVFLDHDGVASATPRPGVEPNGTAGILAAGGTGTSAKPPEMPTSGVNTGRGVAGTTTGPSPGDLAISTSGSLTGKFVPLSTDPASVNVFLTWALASTASQRASQLHAAHLAASRRVARSSRRLCVSDPDLCVHSDVFLCFVCVFLGVVVPEFTSPGRGRDQLHAAVVAVHCRKPGAVHLPERDRAVVRLACHMP